MHPDAFDGPPPLETGETSGMDLIFRDMASLDGFSQHLARREGRVAGGASMRIDNGIAQLCGAATLAEHRRRGIQTALLRERLARAAGAGCDVAVITTEPGSKSQANAQRQGFELLYVRAVLIKAF
jgi:ribosomal protein S18 acetylase RimI-like enzyme